MSKLILDRRTFLAAAAALTSCVIFPRFTHAAKDSDTESLPSVDRLIESMMKSTASPGVVVAVVRDGKLVHRKGYGKKHLPDGAAPDADTIFAIGSLSKAVTAVGAMLLVEQNKLELDQPASKYQPALPEKWKGITVKQFMTHTSGIPQVGRKAKAGATMEEQYRAAGEEPMAFSPGTKEEYNNFNFDIVGDLIATISGSSYINYMTEHVFKPLKMDSTRDNISAGEAKTANAKTSNRATGYNKTRSGELKEDDSKVLPTGVPSGGLESTLNDLLKLEAGLREGKILKPRVMKLMTTPLPTFGSTPGWFCRMTPKGRVINKDGGTGGFTSYFEFVPEHGHAVIMLRNVQGAEGFQATCNQILQEVCGIPLGKESR